MSLKTRLIIIVIYAILTVLLIQFGKEWFYKPEIKNPIKDAYKITYNISDSSLRIIDIEYRNDTIFYDIKNYKINDSIFESTFNLSIDSLIN